MFVSSIVDEFSAVTGHNDFPKSIEELDILIGSLKLKSGDALQIDSTSSSRLTKLLNKISGNVGLPIEYNVAGEMVNLIPDSWFSYKPYMNGNHFDIDAYTESHRVLDICCNSGVILEHFYHKFMRSLSRVISDSYEREDYILKNLLYAFCAEKKLMSLLRMRFYWSPRCRGNIYHYDIIYDKGLNSEFARRVLNSMKFDVVCGNPPYNNDMYLDFVMLGHKLAKTYDLWITPAKFWAKSTCDKDEKFRSMIKDSGDSFVVYKNCKDIFDISEPGGIAYYLLGKGNKNSEYRIKCVHENSVAFQSDFEKHDNLDFLPLHTLNILNKLGKSNFKDTISLKRNYFTNSDTYSGTSDSSLPIIIFQGNKVVGYAGKDDLKTLGNLGMYKCIQNCICGSGSFQADEDGAFLGMPPVYIIKPNEIGKGSFHHLRFFNTASEANHFVEFMSTKLVNFAYICGLCGTTNSAEFYRYIPDPGDFNRIFEDKPLDGYTPDENGEYKDDSGVVHCSLYAKYKLNDKEIAIIESTIRERK